MKILSDIEIKEMQSFFLSDRKNLDSFLDSVVKNNPEYEGLCDDLKRLRDKIFSFLNDLSSTEVSDDHSRVIGLAMMAEISRIILQICKNPFDYVEKAKIGATERMKKYGRVDVLTEDIENVLKGLKS